jgi:hypothetical protein
VGKFLRSNRFCGGSKRLPHRNFPSLQKRVYVHSSYSDNPSRQGAAIAEAHCKLNFIERFWCPYKWHIREHCEYSLESLRRILPEALKSVSSETINRYYHRCMRILNACDSGFGYGIKTFKDHLYI